MGKQWPTTSNKVRENPPQRQEVDDCSQRPSEIQKWFLSAGTAIIGHLVDENQEIDGKLHSVSQMHIK